MSLTVENLSGLSWRARRKLKAYCLKVSSRTFDSDDVEGFLVYARELFNGKSALRSLSNTVAHSIMRQETWHDAATSLEDEDDGFSCAPVRNSTSVPSSRTATFATTSTTS